MLKMTLLKWDTKQKMGSIIQTDSEMDVDQLITALENSRKDKAIHL